MWRSLWKDFDDRARRLIGGRAPSDAVDRSIKWQLDGTAPFCPRPIAADRLHLPELYSGSPWATCDVPTLAGRWLAVVTVNPSIDPDEAFPNRSDLLTQGDSPLEEWFEKRFEPAAQQQPIPRGRASGAPTVWRNRAAPRPQRQATWAAIEREVSGALGVHSAATLGRVAAIVDVVPWKFAKWSRVPANDQRELMELGAPYLQWTLSEFKPRAILAAGSDVRRLLSELSHVTLPAYAAGGTQVGTYDLGTHAIPVFGTVAPTAHGNRFGKEVRQLGSRLRDALGLP